MSCSVFNPTASPKHASQFFLLTRRLVLYILYKYFFYFERESDTRFLTLGFFQELVSLDSGGQQILKMKISCQTPFKLGKIIVAFRTGCSPITVIKPMQTDSTKWMTMSPHFFPNQTQNYFPYPKAAPLLNYLIKIILAYSIFFFKWTKFSRF